MTLPSGQRIGPYEILAPIGKGGMGEVYRGRDTRLQRDVAIKILPGSFAKDTERLRRFEQEARTAGALNHPNILAVYDVGTSENGPYIVSELLEGQTLRERLSEGPVPVRKAIDYAAQIASGLAAAHEKGITHRDLKPDNLFITTDGRMKILDFGLAKVVVSDAVSSNGATLEADAGVATQTGVVLGTAGYMSPEQVRGKPVDHRSDLFNLGAVLYEMISGQRAFRGASSIETMNAILKEDPPETAASNRNVPPGLDRLIHRCLEKSPEERFQSARDIVFALEAVTGSSGAASARYEPVSATEGARRWLPAVAAAVLLVGIGAAYFAGLAKGRRESSSEVTYQLLTYRAQTIFRALFAPDGKTIVFSAALQGNTPEIFTLSPDFPEPRSLGLRNAQLLSVSSKGELALLTNAKYLAHRLFLGTLARMPLGGGAPREILENVREAEWAPDGETLAIIREVNGKDRLEYPAGTVLCEVAGYLSDLRFSPDGKRIAFFEHPATYDDRGELAVVDLAGKKTALSETFWGLEGLAWSRDGQEVLFSGGESFASFFVNGATLEGRRRTALQSAGGLTIHDISPSGTWLVTRDDQRDDAYFLAGGASEPRELSYLDLSTVAGLSADGQMLLFSEENGSMGKNYAVCIRKTDGSPVVRLGEGHANELSADGRWALATIPSEPAQLVLYPTGAGEPRLLERGNIKEYTSSALLPDGKRVLVCGSEAGHNARCYTQEIAGGPPKPITPEGFNAGWVSPDGESGLFKGIDGKFSVLSLKTGEARAAAFLTAEDSVIGWSRDGRAVFTYHDTQVPSNIERVEMSSGKRSLFRRLTAPDLSGAVQPNGIAISKDEKSFAYTLSKYRSQLYLVRGAR